MQPDEPELTLRRCPFCGGEAVETLAGVSCTKCPATCVVEIGATREQAIEAWNTRAAALTAEQVRLAACHSVRSGLKNKARVAAGYFDWQAMADELNKAVGA